MGARKHCLNGVLHEDTASGYADECRAVMLLSMMSIVGCYYSSSSDVRRSFSVERPPAAGGSQGILIIDPWMLFTQVAKPLFYMVACRRGDIGYRTYIDRYVHVLLLHE